MIANVLRFKSVLISFQKCFNFAVSDSVSVFLQYHLDEFWSSTHGRLRLGNKNKPAYFIFLSACTIFAIVIND